MNERKKMEIRECSFSPNLNRRSLKLVEQKYTPLQIKSKNVLQERTQKELDFKVNCLIKKQKEVEALKGCTFKPNITHSQNITPNSLSFYQRNMDWKKNLEKERELKVEKAHKELMKRPKSPASPSSQSSSFNFSTKSMNKDRATSRDSKQKLYDRNFTEKSRQTLLFSHKGSFNRDQSFNSGKGSIDSQSSYSRKVKSPKKTHENLITNMDESMNKIQMLSKRLSSLQGSSYGKHELINNVKMSEKVNIYARTSMKMNGRAEDSNALEFKKKILNNSSNKNSAKTLPFKKGNSPSKSISSVNSVSSLQKYSKDYFSPSSFLSYLEPLKSNNHPLLLNNLKTLKTNK